jgi:hypothetical protein
MLWAEPTASEAPHAVTGDDKAANSDKRDFAGQRYETEAPPASELSDGEIAPDWNVNYHVDQAKIDKQNAEIEELLQGIVRSNERNMSLVQTNWNRQEAAIRQAKAMQAAFDAGTVSMDQLLEAQRRLAKAKTAYVRTVEDLDPDSDRKQKLFIEANLIIADEAINEARRTWAAAYKQFRAGKTNDKAEAESQAREQFYQFKSQRESILRKWKEVQDRTGNTLKSDPTSHNGPAQTDGKQLISTIPPESEDSSAGNTAKRTAVQNEILRRERTQVRHYELQLRGEELKLKDLESALAALNHSADSKDSTQRDQDEDDLKPLIEIARFRVEMRERELNAAKGLLLRRLFSTLGTSHAVDKQAANRY